MVFTRPGMAAIGMSLALSAGIVYNAETLRRDARNLHQRQLALEEPPSYDYADSEALRQQFYDAIPPFDAKRAETLLLVVLPTDSEFTNRVEKWLASMAPQRFDGELWVAASVIPEDASRLTARAEGNKVRLLRIKDPAMFSRRTGIGTLPLAMAFRGQHMTAILLGEHSGAAATEMLSASAAGAPAQSTRVLETSATGRLGMTP